MRRGRLVFGMVLVGGVMTALLGSAVTAVSVGGKPFVYRATVNTNDLDGVEGIGTPGRWVQLWFRQRTFKDGTPEGPDRFEWCAWKNSGDEVYLGAVAVNAKGVFRFGNLRNAPTTVALYPPAAGDDRCRGGLYTELRLRECDGKTGGNCTEPEMPTMHWLNVKTLPGSVGAGLGRISDAYQASLSAADGPNDGPEYSDVIDVDQSGFDTTQLGGTPGQPIEWRCGQAGTVSCPSIAIHDASTVTAPDPEFPFVVATLQGHRPGGSIIASAARVRDNPLGFTVNINVKFRGSLDVNLGCDSAQFFDFSVPLSF